VPHLYSIFKRKNRTLHQALLDNNWIRDISLQHPSFSAQHFVEYMHLWQEARRITLRIGTLDTLTWKFQKNGDYSASSAYHAQFIGTTRNNFETIIWKAWALPNANSSAGLPYKTEFGLLTDCKHEIGQTKGSALYVDYM